MRIANELSNRCKPNSYNPYIFLINLKINLKMETNTLIFIYVLLLVITIVLVILKKTSWPSIIGVAIMPIYFLFVIFDAATHKNENKLHK